MYESSRHPRLRLALAAVLLTGFSAGALGSGGVAGADEGPSGSGSPSGTTGTSTPQGTSQQADQPDPKSDSTAPSSPAKLPRTEHPTGSSTGATPGEDAPAEPPKAASHDEAEAPTSDPTPTVDVNPPASEPAPAAAAPVAPVDVPRDPNKHAQQPNTPTVSRSEVSRPEPTSVAPALRSVAAPAPPRAVTAAPLAAVVAPNPAPTIPPRLDLQLAGLAVDVATVTVSVVHTAASIVAQAFGPSSFLGVPYLLAMSVVNAAAAVGRTLVGAPLSPPSGQFAVNYGILDGLSFFTPTKPPAGANDPSTTVTPEHPLPIILLNGTTATQGVNWSVGAPVLANAGYKVFTFNYGNTTADPNFPIQAVGDIRQSGLELAAEVDRVLALTGATKVILIGHSQGGGILPVYYVNELGGADKVSQIIGLAPSNHGTDFDQLNGLTSIPLLGPLFLALSDAIAPALFQQAQGSPFQHEVYGNGDTRPGVLYTTISSVDDEVVTPYTQQALSGAGVTNVVLQDRYPGLVVGHANIFLSPQAMAAVLDALAGNPAANPLPLPTAVAA
jgi:triacylglycerol esterase/lipase EstA (alpha/beta hydrolase family)